MRIAHLSDLHFGAHSDRVAEALTADLAERAPDIVVVSGDFTQIGSVAEFKLAHDFLDSLPAPFFAVPGNHDIPALNIWQRFTDPYRRYRAHISEDLEPLMRRNGVALAGIKTTRRAFFGLDWSDGSISSGQLRRLAMRLGELHAQTFRIVVAHHPLFHPAEGGVRQDIVARADRALGAFADLGVRLVLSGHFHRSYVRQHETPERLETVEAGASPERHPVIAVQTGSAISTRLRGQPNAYNIVELDAGAVALRRRFWDGNAWAEGERMMTAP